jgi:hypothetical protein
MLKFSVSESTNHITLTQHTVCNKTVNNTSVLRQLQNRCSKLEKIREFESRDIVSDTIKKIKMKFVQIFNLS